ncbi:MAG: hypothetical protein ACPGU1_09030, partial [Myxococcota bacterium]
PGDNDSGAGDNTNDGGRPVVTPGATGSGSDSSTNGGGSTTDGSGSTQSVSVGCQGGHTPSTPKSLMLWFVLGLGLWWLRRTASVAPTL